MSQEMSKYRSAGATIVRSNEFGGMIFGSVVMIVPLLPAFLSAGMVGIAMVAFSLSLFLIGAKAVSLVFDEEGIRRCWPFRRRWRWSEISSIDFGRSRWFLRTDYVLRLSLVSGHVIGLPVRKSSQADAEDVLHLARDLGFLGGGQIH